MRTFSPFQSHSRPAHQDGEISIRGVEQPGAHCTCRIDKEPLGLDCKGGSRTDESADSSKTETFLHMNASKRRYVGRTSRSRQPRSIVSRAWWLCASVLLLLPWGSTRVSNTAIWASASSSPPEYLGEDSVVLITGAAGFIGSQLALALHRTYNVKKVLCIDSMDSGFGMAKRNSPDSREQEGSPQGRTEEEFALFEFKRQRAFHVMQTLGTRAHFYRADFRPSIPEYYDMGEVPILDSIFRDHPDITHLVHLADPYHSGAMGATSTGEFLTQAVPRIKEQTKTGMIEVLLEQLKKVGQETGRTPQFTYASSYEVYNHIHPPSQNDNPNPPPFREDMPITNPSSLRGASKLIDEIVTEAYHSMHGIYSVGLRFFPVYGPWGLPGSPLFEMAERAVSDPSAPIISSDEQVYSGDVRDFVYIDDAIDAIMSAMQFRPQGNNIPPVVINVGSGRGTTLKNVARKIESYFPRADGSSKIEPQAKPTISYASTDRAQELLGFKAKVTLEEGLLKLLSWHFDRVFPYGGRQDAPAEDRSSRGVVASAGLASCSAFDKECLRGAPIFPCASECAHEALCTTSMYDDVTSFTHSLTDGCETVLYTVALYERVTSIPSANIPKDSRLQPFAPETDVSSCNIAFVSERSVLVQRMKQHLGISHTRTVMEEYIKGARTKEFKSILLKHGFWTLVPVITPERSLGDDLILESLPKLSPGLFFGRNTKYAIYCDPNVAFTSVPALLEEAKMQPYLAGKDGATAMLVPSRTPPPNKFQWRPSDQGLKTPRVDKSTADAESVQSAAYRMIHIGVVDEAVGDEGLPLVDSSWLVHILNNEDTRLLRCDIYGEVVQWDVESDVQSLEFIMGLHDLWSRSIVKWAGNDPWWIGDGVATVPQRVELGIDSTKDHRRRLEEEEEGLPKRLSGDDDADGDADGDNKAAPGDNEYNDKENVNAVEREGTDEENGGAANEVVHADDLTDNEEEGEGEGDPVIDAEDGVARERAIDQDDPQNSPVDADTDEKKDGDQTGSKSGKEPANAEGNSGETDADGKKDPDEKEEAEDKGDAKEPESVVEKVVMEETKDADVGNPKEQNDAFGAHNAKQQDPHPDGGELDSPEAGEEAAVEAKPPDAPDKPSADDDDTTTGDTTGDTDRDTEGDIDGEDKAQAYGGPIVRAPDRDVSSYDTWMGVLSSTDTQFFIRIIPSSEVGVVFLDDLEL